MDASQWVAIGVIAVMLFAQWWQRRVRIQLGQIYRTEKGWIVGAHDGIDALAHPMLPKVGDRLDGMTVKAMYARTEDPSRMRWEIEVEYAVGSKAAQGEAEEGEQAQQ